MDAADSSDDKIAAVEQIGVEAARRALRNPVLVPIGLCHYCESSVSPQQLFCPTDEVEPEQSCAVQWEHVQRCRRLNKS